MTIELPSFRSGVYRHCKGGLYKAQGLALEESSLSPVVIYTHLGETLTWTRPLESWQQIVSWPDGTYRPRFVWVAEMPVENVDAGNNVVLDFDCIVAGDGSMKGGDVIISAGGGGSGGVFEITGGRIKAGDAK